MKNLDRWRQTLSALLAVVFVGSLFFSVPTMGRAIADGISPTAAVVPDQVVYAGGTVIAQDGPTLTKTVVQKTDAGGSRIADQFTITLEATTSQSVKEITVSTDAAVTLVLDVSDSMKGPISTTDPTIRLEAGKTATLKFLKSYVESAQPQDQRWISIVFFATDVVAQQEWIDLNDPVSGKANYDKLTSDIRSLNVDALKLNGNTNLAGGLEMGNFLLSDTKVNGQVIDVTNRFAVLITDGEPTDIPKGGITFDAGYTNQNGQFIEGRKKYVLEGTSSGYASKSSAESAAEKLKRESAVPIYAITFSLGTSDAATDTKNWVSRWATKQYDANSELDLSDALQTINKEILQYTNLYSIEDPMGTMIEYRGAPSGSAPGNVFDYKNGTLMWSLRDSDPIRTNGDGTATYQLQYDIALKTSDNGFTNGRTVKCDAPTATGTCPGTGAHATHAYQTNKTTALYWAPITVSGGVATVGARQTLFAPLPSVTGTYVDPTAPFSLKTEYKYWYTTTMDTTVYRLAGTEPGAPLDGVRVGQKYLFPAQTPARTYGGAQYDYDFSSYKDGTHGASAKTELTSPTLADKDQTVYYHYERVMETRYIKAQATDANDGSKLALAEFSLYRVGNDTEVVARGTTDASGGIIFKNGGPGFPLGDYYVKLISPPGGYEMPGDPRLNVTLTSASPETVTVNMPLTRSADPVPEKPGIDWIQGNVDVQLHCQRLPGEHTAQTYALLDGFEVSQVIVNGDGTFSCIVSVDGTAYLPGYDAHTGAEHSLVPQSDSHGADCVHRSVTLVYDDVNDVWTAPQSTVAVAVTCPEPPPPPTAPDGDTVQGLLKAHLTCGRSGSGHSDQAFATLLPGSFTVGAVTGNSAEGYTCSITVDSALYLAQYIAQHGTHTLAQGQADTQAIQLTYDAGTHTWAPAVNADTAAFTLSCTAPVVPVDPDDGGDVDPPKKPDPDPVIPVDPVIPTDPEVPTQPETPTVPEDPKDPTNPQHPPLPDEGDNTHLVPNEDGSFTLLDENDVPLGTWHWDEEAEMWIFDEEVPLDAAPRTGDLSLALAPLVTLGSGLGLFLLNRKRPEED